MIGQSTEGYNGISQFRTVNQLLYSAHVGIDILKRYLKDTLSKPNEGTKRQLIKNILYKYKVEPDLLIKSLFNQEELIELCKLFKLPHTGNKTTLSGRVLARLPVAVVKSKKWKSLKSYILDQLDKVYLLAGKINKRNFISAFNTAIHNSRIRNSVKITVGKQPNHDLFLRFEEEKQVVMVSAWFVRNKELKELKEDTNRIMANILRDQRDFEDEMIYYIYDSSNKFNNDDLELIFGNIETIYKTPRGFER